MGDTTPTTRPALAWGVSSDPGRVRAENEDSYVTEPMVLDGWLADSRSLDEVRAAGYDVERLRTESRRRLPGQMAAARPVFSAFAELATSCGSGSPASS